jgi:sugar/nucleoside kinase (ribokinase family)
MTTPFDVVGLGALNVDVIAVDEEKAFGDEEIAVGDEELADLLAELPRAQTRVFAGGSSFNTLWTIGNLGRSLRLGYVGVQGATSTTGLARSHVEELRSLGITALVETVAETAGVCVALASPSGRRLFTNPGANRSLGAYLDRPATRSDLLNQLNGTAIVHVTSVVEPDPDDEPITGAVDRFVADLRDLSPRTRISLDPGALWTQRAERPAVAALFATADIVFLNHEEHTTLAPDLPSLLTASALVVHKRPDGVELHDRAAGTTLWVPQTQMVDAVDPTGAGDAFAAGLLTGLAEGRPLGDGAALGLELAARRVSGWGDEGLRIEGHR